MPADKKLQPIPAPLPMPKYTYQRPAEGSFSVRYEERREPVKQEAALQNVKFG